MLKLVPKAVLGTSQIQEKHHSLGQYGLVFYFPIFVAQSTCRHASRQSVQWAISDWEEEREQKLVFYSLEMKASIAHLLLALSKKEHHTAKLRKNNLFTRKLYILKNKQNNLTQIS